MMAAAIELAIHSSASSPVPGKTTTISLSIFEPPLRDLMGLTTPSVGQR